MGLKKVKFHAILHIADDILNFGVPMEVDTGSNESGHKPTKKAAKLTQKQRKTFEIQTARRLQEEHLLELAEEEHKGRPLWDYPVGYLHEEEMELTEPPPVVKGLKFRCFRGNDGEEHCRTVPQNIPNAPQFSIETSFLTFVIGLQDAVKEHFEEVLVYSQHKRNGQIFRSSPCYKGSVWRDWVMVNWGDHGVLPNKIWGFIDLTDLPPNSGIVYGGIAGLSPGIYAIVESAQYLGEDFDS